MKALGLLLLLCSLSASAKTDPPMETAKVISQDISSRNGGTAIMPMGTGIVGIPISRHSNVVVVETSSQRLTWVESGNKAVVLQVNGIVHFYRDNEWFVVFDIKHKKHKFSVVHMEALQ